MLRKTGLVSSSVLDPDFLLCNTPPFTAPGSPRILVSSAEQAVTLWDARTCKAAQTRRGQAEANQDMALNKCAIELKTVRKDQRRHELSPPILQEYNL